MNANMPAGLTQQSEVTSDLAVECSFVVVGSGAGGATMAAELADAGVDVVIVEEGGYHPTESFTAATGPGRCGPCTGMRVRDWHWAGLLSSSPRAGASAVPRSSTGACRGGRRPGCLSGGRPRTVSLLSASRRWSHISRR